MGDDDIGHVDIGYCTPLYFSGHLNCFTCSDTMSTTSSAVKPRWTASVRKWSNASWSRSLRTLPGQFTARLGDERPEPGPRVQNPLTLQLGVDPGDRVRIDHHATEKARGPRGADPRAEFPPGDCLAYLMGQLPPNRQPAGRVDGEFHGHLTNCTSKHSTVHERCQEGSSEISRFADCRGGARAAGLRKTNPPGGANPAGRVI